MSGRARRIFTIPVESAGIRRGIFSAATRRRLFASLPIVLVSAIAMSLNAAGPADASTTAKKPLKTPGIAPDSAAPKEASALRQASLATKMAPGSAPVKYVVVEGDTVSGIGGRFGLSTASVLALNGLGWSAVIFPGQVLTLTSHAPRAASPAQRPAASEIARYKIRSGDTISGIAAAHGLSTAAVLSANGLGRSSVIFPGQSIVLPSSSAPASAALPKPQLTPAPEPALAQAPASGPTSHTIVAGETISAVAARACLPVQAILDANGLGWSSIIYPGQVLKIPAITALTAEMRSNAAVIVSVGKAAGVSDHGLVIALATAAQESGLRNVDYGDRDSLGLFQQRPSAGWGSAAQVMDPVRASRAFFGGPGNPNPRVTRGLLDIPGWQKMTVTEAAQAVQVSAYPGHYAKWETSARAWVADLG